MQDLVLATFVSEKLDGGERWSQWLSFSEFPSGTSLNPRYKDNTQAHQSRQLCAPARRSHVWGTVWASDATETITVISNGVCIDRKLSQTGQRTSSVSNPHKEIQHMKLSPKVLPSTEVLWTKKFLMTQTPKPKICMLCFLHFHLHQWLQPKGPVIHGKKIYKSYRSEFAAVFTGHTQGCG